MDFDIEDRIDGPGNRHLLNFGSVVVRGKVDGPGNTTIENCRNFEVP